MRIFLDTCTCQLLFDYGEYLFENDRTDIDQSIAEHPNGVRNLEALHDIIQVNMAGAPSFSFVLSSASIEEIRERGDHRYTQYAFELLDSWWITVSELSEDAYSGEGDNWAETIEQKQFEYLSEEDRKLISDALLEECGFFLTVEEKLPTHADHISRELPIQLLRPFEFWEQILSPHFENHPSWS